MTKLTIIGAGSTVFTKNIVVDLLIIDQFKTIEIALMDIDKNRLIKTKEVLEEGPSEKMSKSKKNVIEPDEILDSYGIDATRIFMISDSPPDRELEWTDEGIQSSKNLIRRIERYFMQSETSINQETIKKIEIFISEIEKNILSFSLNKCVADIYTLFNFLENLLPYNSINPLSIFQIS